MPDMPADRAIAGIDVWRPLRGPFERWPHAADFLRALLAFVLTLVLWSQESGDGDVPLHSLLDVAVYVCAFVGNFALLWRRTHPLVVHVVAMLALVLVLLGDRCCLFGLVFSLYSLGRYESDHVASIVGMSVAVVLIATNILIFGSVDIGGVIAIALVFIVWYVGRRLRFRAEYLRLLEERARHLEREKSVESERAVVAERSRIARDMHDIVAHQVSLMTVQAGAAKTVSETDPAAANDAMAAVEKAGRNALSEMRHLLDVLRPADVANSLTPQPGLRDLESLIREVSDIGPRVVLTMREHIGLPARVELTVYRIVQEALTNVIKHAGKDVHVEVSIVVSDNDVIVSVRDDGQGSNNVEAPGHGLVGMRERVELLDGVFTAGTMTSGGFEVKAALPVRWPSS